MREKVNKLQPIADEYKANYDNMNMKNNFKFYEHSIITANYFDFFYEADKGILFIAHFSRHSHAF